MTASRQLPVTSTGTRRSWLWSWPTTFSSNLCKRGRGRRRLWTVQTRNRRGQTRSRRWFYGQFGIRRQHWRTGFVPRSPNSGTWWDRSSLIRTHRDAVKNWPKLDCEIVQASHRAKLFDGHYNIEAKKKCQILVKNGARFLGIAIGIGQTHPKFHTTPIDGTKTKKPLEEQAPFVITVKDISLLKDPKNAWRLQPNCVWSCHENASGLKIDL